MRRQPYRIIVSFIVLMLFVIVYHPGTAQDNCPELVKKALASVDQLCQGMKRNEACYGNNRLEASFKGEVDLTFSQPADRVPIGDVQTLHTFPLDEKLGLWGVALMNIQANLPDTLPGQAVRFLVYGDVTIKNAGGGQDTVVCTATANTSANIRSGPGTKFNVVTSVTANSELAVIGRNDDGSWLYVTAKGNPGWISTQLVTPACDVMANVPVRDPNTAPSSYGPMQAFYFTTGTGQPACKEAPPSSLVVQSPGGYIVKLNVNGIDVSVGSTLALTNPGGTRMGIQTLHGKAIVKDDGFVRVIPEGFEMDIPMELNDDGDPEVAGTPDELTIIDPDETQYVDEIPDAVFDEPVDAPDTSQWSSIDEYCADPQNADECNDPLFQESIVDCGDGVCSTDEYCEADCGAGSCGDGVCDPYALDETDQTCPADCNSDVSYCGDYFCATDETAESCPNDCGDNVTPVCGDYACDADEDATTCPLDCGGASETCGDGICDGGAGEDLYSCAKDCADDASYCGDFKCEVAIGEDSNTCPNDCGGGGGFCGDNVCDGAIGEDSNSCANDCGGGGGFCGDNVCDGAIGEDSNSCANDCGGGGGFCGDNVCDGAIGEDSNSCANDCGGGGGFCGDNVCDGAIGEDSSSCANDCGGGGGFCGDNVCDGAIGEDSSSCANDCGGGGFCGDSSCDAGEDSNNCPNDCGGGSFCGDSVCDAGEDNSNCPSDCF